MKHIKTKILSSVSGAVLGLGTLYLITALVGYGDFNYKNWPQIKEERTIQQKQSYQNSLRKEFQGLDLNNDAIIDSTEFIYRGDRK